MAEVAVVGFSKRRGCLRFSRFWAGGHQITQT